MFAHPCNALSLAVPQTKIFIALCIKHCFVRIYFTRFIVRKLRLVAMLRQQGALASDCMRTWKRAEKYESKICKLK